MIEQYKNSRKGKTLFHLWLDEEEKECLINALTSKEKDPIKQIENKDSTFEIIKTAFERGDLEK